MSRRPIWLGVPFILGIALVLRLALAVQMGNAYYFGDTEEYQQAAHSLLAGHGPGEGYPRAPLYPMLMAGGFVLGGSDNYVFVRILQLLLGVLVVWLTLVLARVAGVPGGGRLAALGAALAPTLVFTSEMLYPTVLYTALLLGMCVTAMGLDRRPTLLRGAALGILAALLWTTDQVALAPIGLIGVWLLAGVPRGRGPLVRALAATLVAGLLVGVPFARWEQQAYGRTPTYMRKPQYVLYMVRHDPSIAGGREVHDPDAMFRPRTTSQFLRHELKLARRQPLAYLTDYTSEFVHFFKPMPDRIQTQNVYTRRGFKLIAAVYFLPVLALMLFGLLLGPARWRDRLLLVGVVLATDAAYAFFFTQTRYRVPVEPQMLILAALGLAVLLPRRAALGTADPALEVVRPAEPALDARAG